MSYYFMQEYPYCDGVDNPSIPCDETYPNGTYIDGNRPDPYEPCSNIFFMCTNGISSCFVNDPIYDKFDFIPTLKMPHYPLLM